MKLYVKKTDKNPMFPRIIITMLFLLIPIILLILFIKQEQTYVRESNPFLVPLLFSIIFFIVGVYCLYTFIKRPKDYEAELIEKFFHKYNGEEITYMIFRIKNNSANHICKCYTIGHNDFIVGRTYVLTLKECNWEPKYIKEVYMSE